MKTFTKHFFAVLLSAAMVLAMTASVFASGSDITASQEQTQEYIYDSPTEPMAVDENIITASAHRAASPVLGIMGLNATSGFGMINGGAPEDLETAQKSAAMGVWGSSLNDNPDPYYWNYFYNFYAAENGLELSQDALINANVAASPGAADGNLMEEFGNVSYSLSTRPDILVGCSSGNTGDDVSGYDEQLATIHSFTPDSPYYQEGDETYDPQLVSYQMTYIKQMIESVKRLADAADAVAEATGKVTRYEAPQVIAADYETYVYGLIAYIQEQLANEGKDEKTVAVLTSVIDAEGNVVTEIDPAQGGTYSYGLADGLSTSATSLVRAYEYSMPVTKDLLEVGNYEDVDIETTTTGRDGSTETTSATYHVVDLDTLLSADVIITINNQNISGEALNASFGDKSYNGIEITNTPSALYGVTMNSVENAMGYAYVIGCMYNEYVNPIELCAYFYEHFYHISEMPNIEKVVKTNFAQATLPGSLGNTLPSSYSADTVAQKLAEGAQYYEANKAQFTEEAFELIGLSEWAPDFALEGSIAASAEPETEEETTEEASEEQVSESAAAETEIQSAATEDETAPVTEGDTTAQSGGVPFWVWIIIAVCVIVIIVIICVVTSKKKKSADQNAEKK